MYLKSRMLYLYCETPLHAGAGSGLGAVDLPIQRERATGYPIVQASGLKGALREAANGAEKIAVFGPETDKADDHAGAFSPGDARLLLFPVRSLKGVFAWTTSVNALHRWRREGQDMGLALPNVPENLAIGELQCLAAPGVVNSDQTVVLEEFAYKQLPDADGIVAKVANYLAADALPKNLGGYWGELLKKNLVILPDDDFRDFLMHATEILTRVRLEPDSKTVASGALWTEEHLPPDSLLYAPARATRLRIAKDKAPNGWATLSADAQADKVLDWVSRKVPSRLQLGGDETVGRGIVSLRWTPEVTQ